jgi:hypothetical protein
MLGYYLASLGYDGGVEFLDFTFGETEPVRRARVRIARLRLPCSDGSELWFSGTLGEIEDGSSAHDHQFIGVYGWESPFLSELVASAWHFDHKVERLGPGHSFPLGRNSVLRTSGYTSALVLEGDIYQQFTEWQPEIVGREVSILAVVPIGEADVALKRRGGLEALMDEWDREGRDILEIHRFQSV